jgi:branched-chain amino acid transport system permease protein
VSDVVQSPAAPSSLPDSGAKTPKATRLHLGVLLGIAAALVALPFAVYPIFLMKVLCFALFALAFNLLLGFGGLLSFGHAAFFGGAAYVSAHAAKVWGLNPEAAIACGALASMVLGVIIGWLAIRRQGIYFAMITLALAQLVYFACLQAKFTGGEDGIQGVPRGYLFGLFDLADDRVLYAMVATIFMAGLLAILRVIHSPFGQALKAIRENEARATSLGFRVERYKLAVFILSATLAGTAGATKAIVFQLASLTDVHWATSGAVILMTLVGGMGTLFGPIVGAFVVVGMESYLTPFGAWLTIVEGLIFVTCVILFPNGLIGALAKKAAL